MNSSNSKMTPRKKIIKLVNNNASHGLMAAQQTQPNSNKAASTNQAYKTHATLLNNYYQSLQRQADGGPGEPDGVATEVPGPRGVQPHELKQR